MPKYIKKTVIVEAFQSGSEKDWGFLGNLVTTDWVIQLHDGTFHTLSDAVFTAKYAEANPSATLTGDDWD